MMSAKPATPRSPGERQATSGRAVVPGADAEDHEEGELHREAEGLDFGPVPAVGTVRTLRALDPVTAAEIEEGQAARDREREHRGAVAPARGGDHDRGDRPSRPDVQSEISMRGALVPSAPAGTQATPRRRQCLSVFGMGIADSKCEVGSIRAVRQPPSGSARGGGVDRDGSVAPADEPSTVRVSRRSPSQHSTVPTEIGPSRSDNPAPLRSSTRHGRRGIKRDTTASTFRLRTGADPVYW